VTATMQPISPADPPQAAGVGIPLRRPTPAGAGETPDRRGQQEVARRPAWTAAIRGQNEGA
jgi:hypothetical protein